MVIHQIEKILFTLRLALELQENKGKPNAKNNEKPETDGVVPPLGRGSKSNYLENNCVGDNIASWRCTPRFRFGDHLYQSKLLEYCRKREIRKSFSKEQDMLEQFCGFVTGDTLPIIKAVRNISSKYWTFINIEMTHEITLLSLWVNVKIPDFGRSYQEIYEIN